MTAQRQVDTSVRVRYADTDQMGVVYHANYLIWFEVGRTEYMREMGYAYARLEAEEIRMPVLEVECRYLAPARYDDLLRICTVVDEVGAASVRFAYRIVREGDQVTLTVGRTRHAAVGLDGRPRRIPHEVKKCLLQ